MSEGQRYELILTPPVRPAFAERLPEPVAAAVIDFITPTLVMKPQRAGKPPRRELAGIWSARRGTYRVLYRILEEPREVVVLKATSAGTSTAPAGPTAVGVLLSLAEDGTQGGHCLTWHVGCDVPGDVAGDSDRGVAEELRVVPWAVSVRGGCRSPLQRPPLSCAASLAGVPLSMAGAGLRIENAHNSPMCRNPGMLSPELGQRGGDRESAQSSVGPARSCAAPSRAPPTATSTTAFAGAVLRVLRRASGPSSGRRLRRRCTGPEC